MEPASKRRKTGGALTDTDEDELFLEPEELNQKRDPSFLLAKGRAEAAFQLKSRFEDIFAKYEKDFTGIGDEIDLETGEVVVDNGHLSSMRSMKDWIVEDDEEEDEDGVEDGDAGCHQDRNRIENKDEEAPREAEAQGHDQPTLPCGSDHNRLDLADGCPKDPWQISEPGWPSGFASRGLPLLASLLPTQTHFPIQDQSFSPFVHESSKTADPTWQAPELPPSAFLNNMSVSNARHYGGATPVVTRTVLKKSLNLPNSSEADIEDDLQTAPVSVSERENQREPQNTSVSPLIHRNFPAVDSSPHDNNLKDLIQDVISSMPDTPPSIRRSRLLKAQGKPSPLNQEHQVHQRTESKLRLSNTQLHVESRGPPKKRGRKPKVRANPEEILHTTPGDQADQSPWEESDLESFRDITSQGFTKPAGQTLYVHIEGRKVESSHMVTEGMLSDQNANDIGFVTAEDLPRDSPTQYRRSGLTPDHQGQIRSSTTKLGQSRKTDGPKTGEKFKRNVVDPNFAFSDEETLLPRRFKKKEKTQPKQPDPSTLPSPPLLATDLSPQMATEHDDTAVNCEEVSLAPGQAAHSLSRQRNIVQKRPRGRPRKSGVGGSNVEQVTETNPVAMEATLETRKSKEPQVMTSDEEENNTKPKQQRRRSVRSSSDPDPAIESAAINQNKPPLSSAKFQQNPPPLAHSDIQISRQESSHVDQETEQPEAEADAGLSMDPEPPTGQSDLPEDQNLALGSPKRIALAEPQFTHPTTPSRPRAKQVEKDTPTFSASVLSLISESEDDEDELSFDHSDYTPSGHHRILVHRPFPEIPATPRFPASSKSTKKRNSLLPNRSHSSSSHRISKPPRTPRSTNSDKAGNTSHKRTHRKGHRLARSVVRVVRRPEGNEDREGSVLQTPGGTKRRCGENGWKCDRDFCFVCME